jgi:hypothetical protein
MMVGISFSPFSRHRIRAFQVKADLRFFANLNDARQLCKRKISVVSPHPTQKWKKVQGMGTPHQRLNDRKKSRGKIWSATIYLW